jgi:hypothetical protein
MTLITLLNQTITLETFNSYSNNLGDCSYNTAVTLPARVERRIKVVRSLKGENAVSTATIFLNGSITLDKYGRDRITLPDSTTPPILAIEDGVKGDGTVLYYEVDI